MTVSSWQERIRVTHAYAQLCFAAEDFTSFQARASLQEKTAGVYRTSFHKVVEGTPVKKLNDGILSFRVVDFGTGADEKLAAHSKKQGEDLEQNVQACQAEIEKLANTATTTGESKTSWQDKMREKNEENKKAINDQMDQGVEKAIELIGEMPEDKREQAADRYIAFMDFLMGALEKVIEFLNKAWDSVVRVWHAAVALVQEALDQIKEWYNDAKNGIRGALGKIGGIFG